MDSDEEIVPIVAIRKKKTRKRQRSTTSEGPSTSSATADTPVKIEKKSPKRPRFHSPKVPDQSALVQVKPEPVINAVYPAENAVLPKPVLPPIPPVAPLVPRPPIPPLTCDVLKPDTIYYDLGYVVRDINSAIPETIWRTKICSFSFLLDAVPHEDMFDLMNLTRNAMNSTQNKMTHLVDLTHFRLLCADKDDKGLLLIPKENAHELGRSMEGIVHFNGDRSEAIDALRHYLPVSVAESFNDDIALPPLPYIDFTLPFDDGWRTSYGGFMLGGMPYKTGRMPKIRGGLTKSEEVYLVGRVDIPNMQIIVDVYLAENFFAAQGKEEFVEETGDRHAVQQTKRIRSLLEMGKAIVFQDNLLMEMLFVEKGYVPERRPDQIKLLGDHIDPKDLISLFRHVRNAHADQTILTTHNPQHPRLKLKMHAYQKRAVSWMATREFAILKDLSFPHPLYFPVETLDGYRLFMHAYTGRLSEAHPSIKAARGGILADEMGLGKTLEMISLVLSNPSPLHEPKNPDGMLMIKAAEPQALQCYCGFEERTSKKPRPTIACISCGVLHHKKCAKYDLLPKDVEFLCSKCQRDHRVECKTTLVVAPAAIIGQWHNEIKKSARDLEVIEYKGVASAGYVSPWELAYHDIVLASYEMLSKEILYLHAEARKESLRNLNKRVVIRSPLLAIKFWRFVLDEAQMVESQTSNYAQMAMKIQAQFYWAVSGTPIQHGVADLQSLFSFIELNPWAQARWFNEYIAGPFKAGIKEPLQDTLGECMWRLEKSSVEGEMDLPPCTTIVHNLTFSGIEMQLYQQVYRDCIKVITSKLRQRRYQGVDIYSRKVSDLDGDLVGTLKTWMAHLEKLCTSPTRVKYFFKEMRKKKDDEEPTSDDMDSLKRVVKTLVEKARLEFTNGLRTCIMAKSGAAGIYWLMEKFPEAAEMYRDAKRLWTDNEQFVQVDIGQKLHILSNLGQLIAEHRQEIPQTLEDDQLLDRAEAVKIEFMGKNVACREKANAEVREAWVMADGDGKRTEVRHDGKTLDKAIMPVYAALRCVGDCDEDETELVQQCKLSALGDLGNDGKRKYGRSRGMNATYRTLDGLKLVLQERWSTILKERGEIIKQVDEVMEHSMKEGDSFVLDCAACHMRTDASLKRCRLCVLEKAFIAYEDIIFRTVVTFIDDEDDDALTSRQQKLKVNTGSFADEHRESSWADSDFEKVCKTIATYLRNKREPKNDRGVEKKKYAKEYLRCEAEWKQFQLIIDLVKKEHKSWRALWRTVYNEAGACDELRQSVMRLRFATEDEMAVANSLSKPKKRAFMDLRSVLDPKENDLEKRLRSAQMQYVEYAKRLAGDISRFKYVQNMHDSYINENGVQARECCVCYDPVGKDWALFPCAHVICRTCLKELEKNEAFTLQAQCPVCRKMASSREILQANGVRRPLSPQKTQHFDTLRLRGAPQKMEAVVREVFRINVEEPDAKILIFSDYTDVLEDYMWILHRNGVSSTYVKTKAFIPNCIEKLRSGGTRILLMPISMGGKGLTIIEATHVFFLEPIMNKGAELQAIGRIHRMGQTKPTFVHKFIVQQTIEEQINTMMSSIGEEGNLSQQDLTLRQTLDLLKSAGFQGPDAEDADIWNIQPETIVINGGVEASEDNQPSTSGL